MKSSWKTTAGGTLTAAGAALMGAAAMDWLRPDHKYGFMVTGLVLTIIGPMMNGIFGRDNDVSSEEAGLKTPEQPAKPFQPRLPLLALSCFLAAGVVVGGGCKSTTANASRALVTTVTTVDSAMTGWGTWVAMGKATPAAETRVRAAYGRYQAAELAAEHALIGAIKAGNSDLWLASKAALLASQQDLLALVAMFTRTDYPPPIPSF